VNINLASKNYEGMTKQELEAEYAKNKREIDRLIKKNRDLLNKSEHAK